MPCSFRQKAIVLLLLISAALLFLPVAAWAQARGTLTGTITDQGGAFVPKAKITLTNEGTQGRWESQSTEAGSFTIPDLPPGVYDLAVSFTGFKEYIQKGITIRVGDTATVDVNLKVGQTTETVEVHADAQQVKADSSDVGTSVQSRFANDLPLQVAGQARSPMQFIALDPGFTGYTPNNPANQQAFKLNGGQEGGSAVLVDGANVNLVSPNVQVTYGVSPDAVQEFKVMTATFSAEYGRASGGVVNLVTKSGTNSLHGSAYEYFLNESLNANGWMNNRRGIERQPFSQKDFGVQVAGPVWTPKLYDGRNKTFFMFSYEAFRQSSHGNGIETAATDAWNKGDFSSLLHTQTAPSGRVLSARQLYDYSTCGGLGSKCQPFAGNQIPQSRMDKVFQNALPYLAHATDQSRDIENTSMGYSSFNNANTFTGKIDQYIGSRQKLMFLWSSDERPRGQDLSYGPIFSDYWGWQSGTYARLAHDFTISPTLLNHFNFGFSRRYRLEGTGLAGAGLATKIGLKGVMDNNFPAFEMRSGTWGGRVGPGNGDSQFADNTYQVNDNVSWQKGRHAFKFGFEMQRQQFNTRRRAYASGDFQFNDAITGNGTPNTGLEYASFYLGTFYSHTYPLSSQIPQGRYIGLRPRYYSGFVQDDFKVSPRLTLNLGVRYDLNMPTKEAHDRLSWMDPTVPNPGADGLLGAYVFAGEGQGRTGLSSPQTAWKKGFGPRAGLAYSVDSKTVVRAGYGIYYSAVKVGGFADADAYGFTGSYTFPDPGNDLIPAGKLDQISGWPGKQPPFIDPTVQNGQGPSVILSKVARPGTIQNWTIDIQRQVAKDLMVDVAYVGNHADHLQSWMRDPNQLDPKYMSKGACLQVNITDQATDPRCAGQQIVPLPFKSFTGTVAQALRPFPQYSNATLDNSSSANPFGFSTYHALQAKVEKRFSNDLTVLATFVWAKTLTNADSEYPGQASWNNNLIAGTAQNQYNSTVEKALSVQDVPRRLMLAYSYELPIGKGKKLLNKGGIANTLIGGWNIAAIQTYAVGLPLSVFPDGSYDPGTFSQSRRANVVSGVNPGGAALNSSFNFDSSLVLNPKAFANPANFTYGTAPRILNLRQWPTLGEDVTMYKNFAVRERFKATIRLDAFDILNRHVYDGWDMRVTSETFGKATGASGNRTCQLSLRVSF